MSPRQRAKDLGAPTYQGLPCPRCGGTERRTSNYDCAQCSRVRAADGKAQRKKFAMGARRAAVEAGAVTYLGQPCPRDGTQERYTRSGSCVRCARARMTKAREDDAPRALPADMALARDKRDQEQRLALVRAAQSAKQRRAMGLPG